jgi:hypothetical protein
MKSNEKMAPRQLEMAPFKEALGEDIPDFPLNKLGRYRLMQALRYKYGPGFKNVSGAVKLLALFDREMKLNELGV